MKRQRLDCLLLERGLVESREQARRLILAGEVLVNGQVVTRPAVLLSGAEELGLKSQPPFVSRAGLKLEAALDRFQIDVQGRVAIDVGASTGGFTDCLLQRGASRVYAVDVGYGQLAWKLRQDPRVIVMERVNARYLDRLPEVPDLATFDVSFISLQLVIPPVVTLLERQAYLIPLIKPQFEAGREHVGKGGVVKDPRVHREVLLRFIDWARSQELAFMGLMVSPLRGPAGNVEFPACLGKGLPDPSFDASEWVERCLNEVS
jgi:23S rRNA (cytidine1920-2'-O)/16S rRNA (cytidine1409-2'-O)-methyltransferase